MNCLKEIGIITIILCFSFIGILKTYRLKKRLEKLEEFLDFLQNVKSEIAFSSLSLHEIISSSNNEFANQVNKNLVFFAVPTAIKKACQSYFINEEDMNLACKITDEFGKYDSESQTQFIENNIEKIRKMTEKEKSEIKEKTKVNLVFYSFLGLAIAIVLL